MSDIVKWGLLTAGLIALVALVFALPVAGYLDLGEFNNALNNIINISSSMFLKCRCLINNFLLPFGRTVLSGIMIWLIGKWAIMISIKIVAWVYHFIFRG